MGEDVFRDRRIRREIETAGLDAVLCQLIPNVLKLTGYAPVQGQSFALFPVQGEPSLVVPEGEDMWARNSGCTDVQVYPCGLLDPNRSWTDVVAPILASVVTKKGLDAAFIGYEGDESTVSSFYPQVGYPSPSLFAEFQQAVPGARLVDASATFAMLRSFASPLEARSIGLAAEASAQGFRAARALVQVGASESAVANAFETAVRAFGPINGGCQVVAFAHVVSGSRSAQACLPGVLSTDRLIQTGDPVLVQIEVCVGGYWVNASRTFFAGDPGAEGRRIYAACLESGERARAVIRNGARASDVDAAARSYLADDGFGPCMRGAIGHGVGFEPLSIRQPPRLFPGSADTIETDMAIALRPGVFVRGWGGVRIGDVVVAEARGSTLLTNIPRDIVWATVPQRARF